MLSSNLSNIPLALQKLFIILIFLPGSICFPAEHGRDASLGYGGSRYPCSSSLCFPAQKNFKQKKRYTPETGESIRNSKQLLSENCVHWESKPVLQNDEQSQLLLQRREECFPGLYGKASFPPR